MASIVKCRNLSKNQLGGVIFGCTNNTKNECVTKKLFGLPAQHFSYVKNIEPGLPLFLFNYSERKLYGIYEAVSSGKMYIDSYGWTSGGSERTRYPAQVQIRVRLECQALSETLFKPTIVDNYYSQNHFLFELDHVQASKLISKLTSLAFAPSVYTPQNSSKLLSAKQRFPLSIQRKETQAPEPPYFKDDFANSRDPFGTLGNSDDSLCLNGYNLLMEASLVNKNAEPEEKDLIHMKLKELARHRQHSAAAITGQSGEVTYMEDVDLEHETHENGMSNSGNRNNESPCHSLDSYATIAQLCQEMEELKAFTQEQTCKMGILEKKLAEAELEIRRLRKVCMRFESVPETSMTIGASTGNETAVESPDLNELIFLAGGYDGVSWSKALHSFSPVNDVLKSLKPMSTLRSYASVAKLDEELNVFGGGDGSLLYDTVESYNPVNNQWTLRPSLNTKKGHLASATIHGNFFAVDVGNGAECFSDVEMFDSDVGRWISTRSMLQKFTYRKIENKEDSLGNQFSSADPKVFSKNLTRPAKRQRLADDLNAAYDVDDSCDSDVGQSLTKYSAAAVALADSSEEKKRRENRSKRFEKKHGNHAENSKFKANNVEYGKLYARRASALILSRNVEESGSRAVEDIDWDALTVKGTCQEIEKRYLRLTSAPDPATVRPEEVLEKALLMVQNSQKNYLYKCDQLKSIRQDLTVQHIRNEITVKVYEMHARLSMEVGDLPEYNQCQSQLKVLYAEGIRGCNMEFAAYNLLCVILHSNNNREILSAMSRLSADARKHEAVKHALLVHAAVTSGNYVTFFRLYKTAPNINTFFMDLYVEKMRYAAVKCMCRSYRPTVPISYIAQILSFINALPTTEASDHKEVEGVEECVDWLKTHGACLTSDDSGELLLDTKASVLSLYMPEPEDAVAHGDASLAVNDFLTQNLA